MAVKTKKEGAGREIGNLRHADAATAKLFDLKPHIVGMMLEEPFFAKLMRVISKIRTERVSTAGVLCQDGDLKLWWNPAFMAALEAKHVRGVLKHECLHLVFEHTTTRKFNPHIIWNYATDLAINSHIADELPEFCLLPGRAFKALTAEDKEKMGDEAARRYELVSAKIASFPLNKAAEWYFARLMEDKDVADSIQDPNPGQPGPGQPGPGQPGGDGEGTGEGDGDGEGGEPGEGQGNGPSMPGTLDDHDGWGEGMTEEEREFAKAKIRQAASDAAKECDKKGQWGSIPAELRRQIRAALVAEVPWQKVLERFLGTKRRATRSTSWSTIHSAYGPITPGVKRGHTAAVATYIDQSGSVGDDELALCFGELANLAKKTTFTCYHFDTEVDEDSKTVWKRNGHPATRTRGGGTCFEAPSKHANKRRKDFDGYIILTDGFAGDPGPSKVPRAWIITPEGAIQEWMAKYKNDTIVTMRWPKSREEAV